MIKKYLLSSVYHIPDDEKGAEEKQPEKSAKELEREQIQVTVGRQTTDENDEEIKKEEPIEEKIEENKEEVEDLEAQQAEAKTQREKDRIQRRIDKLNGENKDLKKEVADLKAKLAAKPDDEKVLTEADVETLAEQKANERFANREFINAVNRLDKEAKLVDKDFKQKINEITDPNNLGPIPGEIIAVLDELDNGGAVLSHLANNEDDIEEVYELAKAGRLSKMSVKLAKISDKIEADKKKPVKEISKVPAPNEPIGGKGANAGGEIVITGKETTEEYIRKRNEQDRRKHEARFGGMRR